MQKNSNKKNNNVNLTHEIILGVVSGVGTDVDRVIDEFQSQFSPTNYKIKIIHLSKLLNSNKKRTDLKDIDAIKRCNSFRESCKRTDAMSLLASARIKQLRDLHAHKIIYIIRQLKNPYEIKTLRKIYGKNFLLISIYDSIENRQKYLKKLSNIKKLNIEDLLKTDEKENNLYGQKQSDAFAEADYFIPFNKLEHHVKRFRDIMCGDLYHTPTKDELCMAYAWNASIKSCDLSRQVGAVIATENGETIATGCNDVPKFGGGTFWEGELPDYRDYQIGVDANDSKKRDIILNFIREVITNPLKKNTNNLSKKISQKNIEKQTNKIYTFLKKEKNLIFNITEYCRSVHAEEAAICDAAKRGVSIHGATLYTTTFPCHLCTKHIIAAGIKKVIYIFPYTKSQAKELFSNMVSINPRDKLKDKVLYESFMGVAPRKILKVFLIEPDKRKKTDGTTIDWSINNASSRFLSTRTPLSYYYKEIAYINLLQTTTINKKINSDILDSIREAKSEYKKWNNRKKFWAMNETNE